MNTNETIGKEIRAKRKELGFTQAALANLMGLPAAKISAMENGRYSITVSDLYEFCTQFKCKPHNIITTI